MSPLIYLLRRSMVNTLKGIVKKPVVLIGYIIAAIFILFMIGAAFFMPSGTVRHGTPEMFRALTTGIFAVIIYFSLRLGIDKGSTYFRMSDVNFLFQAPFRPNQVLIYGFLKQIGGTLLLMAIALFQIPNLKNNFVMKPYGPLIIMLAVLMFMFAYPVFAMLMYSWSSKSTARRKLGKRIIDGAAILTVGGFLLKLSETRDLGSALVAMLDSNTVNWVPFIGWIKMVLGAAVDGITPSFWLGIGLTIGVVAAFTIWIYRMNLDYYEEVLEATEYTEAAYSAKKEGRNLQFNLKVKSGVRQKMAGSGGMAIFSKTMLEMRKTAWLLFVDRTTVTVVAASLAFRLFMPDEARTGGFVSMFSILGFSVYMLFFFSVQGRWALELGKPYIFLIPASTAEKLFFATLAEHLKNMLDGALLFIISGILFKAEWYMIIACIFSYVMFGAVFQYGDVLARRIFGGVHGKSLMMFLKLFFVLLILVPGIAAVVVVGILFQSTLLMILAFGGWGMIAAVSMFFLSLGVFDNLESAG